MPTDNAQQQNSRWLNTPPLPSNLANQQHKVCSSCTTWRPWTSLLCECGSARFAFWSDANPGNIGTQSRRHQGHSFPPVSSVPSPSQRHDGTRHLHRSSTAPANPRMGHTPREPSNDATPLAQGGQPAQHDQTTPPSANPEPPHNTAQAEPTTPRATSAPARSDRIGQESSNLITYHHSLLRAQPGQNVTINIHLPNILNPGQVLQALGAFDPLAWRNHITIPTPRPPPPFFCPSLTPLPKPPCTWLTSPHRPPHHPQPPQPRRPHHSTSNPHQRSKWQHHHHRHCNRGKCSTRSRNHSNDSELLHLPSAN